MRGITFLSDANAFLLQKTIIDRVPHEENWVPFTPYESEAGIWCCEIADSILPFLSSMEKNLIEDLPAPKDIKKA